MNIDNATFAREIISAAELRSEVIGADLVPSDLEEVIESMLDIMDERQRKALGERFLDPDRMGMNALVQASGYLCEICKSELRDDSGKERVRSAA